jgi:hypothetical protein
MNGVMPGLAMADSVWGAEADLGKPLEIRTLQLAGKYILLRKSS